MNNFNTIGGILKMNQGFIGVIIGGIIGIIGGVISQRIQITNEKRVREYQNKEETYLKCIDIMTRYFTEIPKSQYPNKIQIH